MIGFVTEVLRELRLIDGSHRPRYNVVITRAANYLIEAHVSETLFYHIKTTEIDIENVRSCFEATRRASAIFGEVVPEPIACVHRGAWEVFVSEGVYFKPLRVDELLSPSGRHFKGVIDLLSRANREARAPATTPHSRFLTVDVLDRIRRPDLNAVIQPWL